MTKVNIALFALASVLTLGRPSVSEAGENPSTILFREIKNNPHLTEERFIELVKGGARPWAETIERDARALHFVARFSANPKLIWLILEDYTRPEKRREAINVRDKKETTPLMWSAYSKTPEEIVPTLIEAGADVNAVDRLGASVLLHVVESSPVPTRFIATLVNAGADVNFRNKYGRTPLFLLHKSPKPREAAEALLAHGADVSIEDENGMRAVDYIQDKAREEGREIAQDIIDMLQ